MNFNITVQKIAILLFFIMFVYSGINKIPKFNKLVSGLAKKTDLPYPINELGMIGVILLEIIGALVVVYYIWFGELKIDNIKLISKETVKYIILTFIAFMIVVTPLYHPPNKAIIPFLANVTTTGGFLLIYNLL
jgi:hypothetical protein|tara:strand:- start:1085 stop:1486 length:402 start_codon:yes stop_codon:yes gene_type:complete